MKIVNPCPKCGLVNIRLVTDHERQCTGIAPKPSIPTAERSFNPGAGDVDNRDNMANGLDNENSVANTSCLVNSSAVASIEAPSSTDTYRYRNVGKRRAYMRELMRKRRRGLRQANRMARA
jgi:hypothetical protein